MTDQEQGKMNPRDQLVKEKSCTMEFFLETRNIDLETEQMLRRYDKNNDGEFSKDEVVSVIIDLSQESLYFDRLLSTNRLLKRLLCVAFVFSMFLLGGMFALSYTVAKLTMKTDVNEQGALVKAGTTQIVSTDDRAEVHYLDPNEYGVMCVTRDEAELMKMEIEAGRNVLIVSDDQIDGTSTTMRINGGSTRTMQTSGDTTYFCWTTRSGREWCFQQHFSCHADNTGGRRLSHEERAHFEAKLSRSFSERGHDGRHLGDDSDYGYGLVPQPLSTNTTRFLKNL